MAKNVIDPNIKNPPGFDKRDGTVAFYSQVGSLVDEETTLLDLGAGRASWFEDNTDADIRAHPRYLKDKVKKLIAVDVDPIVLQNRTAHECHLMEGNRIPLDDRTVDVVVSDFVLEHVANPEEFFQEVNRVLRPGGWFCARTPHKYNYVSIIARLVKNERHASVLSAVQPNRNEIDVFPTAYRMNTTSTLRNTFREYKDYTYIYKSEPSYTFGYRSVYHAMLTLHKILPKTLYGTLFVFTKKPSVP